MMLGSQIEFVRLNAVALPKVMALLNEPRNARHMPLVREFGEVESAEWVARVGFVPDREVSYDGVSFQRYQLTREAWAAVSANSDSA